MFNDDSYDLVLVGTGFASAFFLQRYLARAKKKVRVLVLERGVLHDETRAITRNRQPGKCCDTGCTQPGQPVMVPLPATKGNGS